MPAEHVPQWLQLAPKIVEVVNLAVEDDHEPTRPRWHRLMPVCREIDDRQPAEAKRDATVLIDPDAAVIGSTVREWRAHPAGVIGQLVAGEPRCAQKPGKSTHGCWRNLTSSCGRSPIMKCARAPR